MPGKFGTKSRVESSQKSLQTVPASCRFLVATAKSGSRQDMGILQEIIGVLDTLLQEEKTSWRNSDVSWIYCLGPVLDIGAAFCAQLLMVRWSHSSHVILILGGLQSREENLVSSKYSNFILEIDIVVAANFDRILYFITMCYKHRIARLRRVEIAREWGKASR